MADTKLADLTSGAPAAASDILYVVRDPSGTPLDRKLTIANVKDYILGLANTWTGKQTISGASFTLSGNISAPAWTTSGIRYANVAATLTDTSSSGTVATAYTDLFGGNTIAASNATTFTDYFTMYVNAATAGTNVTMTNKWALGLGGNLKLGPDASGTNQAGTNVIIGGSRGTGTGAGGSIIFQVAPAGSTGTAQNALATALQITSANLISLFGDTNSASNSLKISNWYGGADILAMQGVSAGSLKNRIGFRPATGGITLANDLQISWTSSTDLTGATDVAIWRDAANTLALRNGANAQTFRVYNTYDGTNDERGFIKWASNVLQIGTDKTGTGTARALEFQTNGVTRLTIAASGPVSVSHSAGLVISNTGGNGFSTTGGGYIIFKSSGVLTLSDVSDADFGRLQFGGTTSSFPALKRNGAGLDIVGADNTNVSFVRVPGVTVASLPSASTAGVGARSFVTDATATTYASTVSGGGANKVPVYSDGTNWLIG